SFSKKLGTEYVFVGDEFTTNPLELVGNDVVTSVTLTSAGAASAAIEGDYPVIPSSAVGSGLSNYSITYQNGTLSVVNRTILTIEGLTIAEKEYDGTRTAVVLSWGNLTGFEETFENVQLDITNAVILFDNKNAGNNKTVIVTGLALTGDDEWLYAINDQIVSGNILPKPLTIAAQNCSKTYGETDPDFTVSYNGFIAGENESVLEGTLSVSREPGEDVDSYAITPSGLSSNNYSITFDAGVFTIAPKELIVTATNAEKVYGSIDPVFAASYSGFEFGENQSVLTGELHLTREVGEDVDSYSITPSGLSASNYSISYVSGVLTITPKTLTITAENKTKVYGSDDPAFSIEYSGFVSGDDLTSLSGSLGYTREAGEDVGTYAVTPNGYSSINYNINYVDGLLGITKKALVVSADNVEKVYGSNDPEFSVTYTGFALDDDNAVLAGTLAFSREVGEDAGNYVITPSGLSSTNYSISFDNGELVIIPKDLTISAVNDTKVYGESDPQFAATYSGFITGEDETILSGNLEFNRAHGEDVGDYAVTPEGLTSNNYNLIFTSTGKLTVTPKPLTVTASNATKVYGSSDPAFSVTYSEFAFSENQSSLGGTLAFDRIAGETVGNYTITPSGLLSDNYSISFATGTLAITQKELTITAVNKSKVYGDADPVFTVTYTGFITGEDESVLSGTLAIDRVAGEDVGNYVITPSGLTATNYSVSFANGTLTVNEKELTVGGTFTVANREYDGLIAAAIATNSLTLTGALSSDNVTLNPVAAFADKNVGTSKIVSLTNTTTLAGTDAGNYTLTLTGAPTATANITPKALSVTGATVADKVYDGTTNATISGATLVGTVGNDVVTLGNATTGTFAQKSVGTDIAVTTAMTISGTDASNYTITQPSGLQADITTKELTVGGSFTVLDKVYDENTVATISENNLTLVTPVTGDVVSLTGIVAAFSDAEVGNDKIVTITAASLDGTDKGNYSLSLTGAPTATASITASSTTTFTVTFSVVNGNGTLTATVDGSAISSGDEVLASKDVVFTATPA
ncbi:MAG TPA: MBG domain-containing protein, partial [Tenuifilaceae bacterium]|nr:MBG domain-containing protein [Tenuifilaceae bacterium]